MLTFWKLNHEQTLQWTDDSDDLSTFIVVVAEKATEFGLSTYLCSNRDARKAILNRCVLLGHHTLHPISQFDTRLESGVSGLQEGMRVVGLNALRTFLDVHCHRSFTHSSLKRVLACTEVGAEKQEVDLGYLSDGSD